MQAHSPPLSPRAHARAAVLLVVCLIHGIFAAPLPRTVKASDLTRPAGIEEIDRWLALFALVGYEPERADFEAWVLTSTKWWGDTHAMVKKPFLPMLRYTGTGQGWALFAAPETHPHRLEVHVRIGDDWQLVYRRFDPDADLLDATFRFRRVRGVYDGSATKKHASYDHFARWVNERALAAYPDATEARVQMVRLHTVAPGLPRDPKEEPRRIVVTQRDALERR